MEYKELKRIYWGRLKDEIEDADRYMTLSQEAEHLGKTSEAIGLATIAREEYTHARFFKELVKDDTEQPDEAAEIWQAWHNMVNRLKNF